MRRLVMPKRAAIFGSGPAGLFAAHALAQNGYEISIYSQGRKSRLYGCQYLHAPIPGLTDEQEPREVSYELRGTAEDYRTKVYGQSAVTVSVETLTRSHQAWDIRAAYDRAWDLYSDRIYEMNLEPRDARIARLGFRCVVNSIPRPVLCNEEHEFRSQEVWAIGDAPDLGQLSPVRVAVENQVICDATPDTGWYRNANVFGYTTVEWPGRKRPPYANVAMVAKPTGTTCTCWPEITHVGRFGTWDKSVLAHTAYTQAAAL